jgi:RNA polymerase sigma-70 factor, ECF subfamily
MTDGPTSRADCEGQLAELRPKLHSYCARMIGSVIEAEDVVQEALLKAIEALPQTPAIANLGGWAFRIAHNTALDFLRRRSRYDAARSDEDLEIFAEPGNPVHDRQIAAASLRTFMRLPVGQRSAVILRDVLGYSVQEAANVMGGSIPAVKAALQRGRLRLRELAREPDDLRLPVLTEPERSRLTAYVERFNARDFDAIRNMLADDVRLDLVNRLRASGRGEVGGYFHNYSLVDDWYFVPGFVDGRPAILVCDPNDLPGRPTYFVLLDWERGSVVDIRDYRFARYVTELAELIALAD